MERDRKRNDQRQYDVFLGRVVVRVAWRMKSNRVLSMPGMSLSGRGFPRVDSGNVDTLTIPYYYYSTTHPPRPATFFLSHLFLMIVLYE